MMETLSHIAGIGGLIAIILSGFLAWRKDLLNFSFEEFQSKYRTEMDDFKTTIRGYINKNEERHTATLNRIVELFEQTHKEVTSQANICKVVQAKKEGGIKADDMWRHEIERELNEVRDDVKHIKKVINHVN